MGLGLDPRSDQHSNSDSVTQGPFPVSTEGKEGFFLSTRELFGNPIYIKLQKREWAKILYCDYKRTLASKEDIGQILDLLNMHYDRLVTHAGPLTLGRKS